MKWLIYEVVFVLVTNVRWKRCAIVHAIHGKPHPLLSSFLSCYDVGRFVSFLLLSPYWTSRWERCTTRHSSGCGAAFVVGVLHNASVQFPIVSHGHITRHESSGRIPVRNKHCLRAYYLKGNQRHYVKLNECEDLYMEGTYITHVVGFELYPIRITVRMPRLDYQ